VALVDGGVVVTVGNTRGFGRRHAGWMSVALAGSLVTACTLGTSATSGNSTAAQPGSTSPGTSSARPASLVEVAKEQAVDSYVAMWQSMAQAATTSDWQSPLLSQYATGDALSAISRGMYADNANGLITKGAPKNYPQVTSVDPPADPTVVMISDCGDSTNWLKYRKADGQLSDDKPGGRQAITAEVKKQQDGVWRVARFAVRGVGSCTG
jgi:hypothetical protein